MGKRRTDKIVAVTVAKYATMYIEASTPEEAMKYAKKYGHLVDPYDFEDFVDVESAENYTTESNSEMKEIWVDDGVALTIDEYWDELDEQGGKAEEIDKRQLNLFDNMEE